MDLEYLIPAFEPFGKVLYAPDSDRGQQRAFGRERELDLMVKRLSSAGRKSFILLGPSGSGKTAIIHELARRAIDWHEPWIFVEMSSNMVLAGTRYLGELETRLKQLVDLAKAPARVVLTYTDISNIATAGMTEKSNESVGTFLAPFLESGAVTICGECTAEQFRLSLEHNVGFSKLLEQVRVEEPKPDDTRAILRSAADQFEQQTRDQHGFGISFPDRVLDQIQDLSRDFFPGQVFPGKAMRLVEQVVQNESERGIDANGDARDVAVTQDVVIRALERFTGIPRRLLDDSLPLKLEDVRAFLESRVVGQTEAVDVVVDLITLIKAGVTDPKKPSGVFLFVGPTGVGKTELAKALAEYIFGSPDRMLRYDMSEYKDFRSFEKLIGDPQARDQSPMRRGSLVSQVRQQPFAVILLDEIEKAHPNIFDLFLQVFDDGRLTDAVGQVTNFTKSIIIMTSNIGSDLARPKAFGFKSEQEGNELHDSIRDAMKGHFRPEFLNRLDRVVKFEPLKRKHLREIAERELKRVLSRNGITRRELRIDVDPGVLDVLLKEGFSREYGARPLKRAVERLALLPIAKELIRMPAGHAPLLRLFPVGDALHVRVVEDGPAPKPTPEIRHVTVTDPVRNRKIRLTPDQVHDRAEYLAQRVQELEAKSEELGLAEHKTELVEQSGQPDFFANLDQARDVMGEINRLERLTESVERVRKRVDDLQTSLPNARKDKSPANLARLAERLYELDRHVDLVEYSLVCQGNLERADAVVCVSLIDREPAPDDVVGMLADMYTHWAGHKGFKVSMLHEELFDAQRTREIVFLVDGPSACGILQGEEGVHEFIYGKTSKKDRTVRFARVRVLPVVSPAAVDVSATTFDRKSQAARGSGLRVAKYKTQLTVTHKPSLVSIRARTGLAGDQAASLCTDWLNAELAHRERVEAEGPPAEAGHEAIVRKYTLQPNALAKDSRTGVSTTALKDLWNGALDEFLHAWLTREAMPAGR